MLHAPSTSDAAHTTLSDQCTQTLTLHVMDLPLKELDRLQKLSAFPSVPSHPSSTLSVLTASALATGKGKQTVGVSDSLDSLLASLHDVKARIESGIASEQDLASVARIVEEKKKEIDERQKEIHATLGRIGKSLDKVCVSSELTEDEY